MKTFRVNLDDGTHVEIGPMESEKWVTIKRLEVIGRFGIFDQEKEIYFPAHRVKNVVVEEIGTSR